MEIKIGQKVQTMRAWPGVPKFTNGYVVEKYQGGYTVAWDLPNRRFPKGISFEEIAKMPETNPMCPLRDGFSTDELYQLVFVFWN